MLKKLLIIQKDGPYFLFETLQVLERFHSSLKDFEITVHANTNDIKAISNEITPMMKGLTSDASIIQGMEFDLSANLSMDESSWDLHATIKSTHKIGPYRTGGELILNDLWSTYLLTLKARAPFMTFHLQDIYKNILGIRSCQAEVSPQGHFNQIIYGMSSPNLFSPAEQESFLARLTKECPGTILKDVSEIDLIEDVSRTLYIGPATLEALKFCEAGGRGIFLTSTFQGFNLLPSRGKHLLISSRGEQFHANPLLKLIDYEIQDKTRIDCPYSVYSFDHESFNGTYLQCHTSSDANYPFYQAHLVLWNFLLNLSDVNLEISRCSSTQIELLSFQHQILSKLIRLQDYSMSSADAIYAEAKSDLAVAEKIQGHINHLLEIESVSEKLSASHAFLRPFLDFYRLRRSQIPGTSLLEQSQANLIVYAEEHQALIALQELFSVTLRKNEVNI